MEKYTFLGNADNQAIQALYDDYKKNPESVEYGWRKFFEGFEFSKENFNNKNIQSDFSSSEFNVIDLINAYRERGHLFTKTNPVRTRRKYFPTLDIENFGLSENDLEKEYLAGNEIGIGKATLKEILNHLQTSYCQSIGVEYMYIRKPEIVEWLKLKIEKSKNTPNFNKTEKEYIFEKLSKAVLFEKFLHKKFPGQKSFSLEGAETLIPALDLVIKNGNLFGIEEFVVGMAHRGRLNVLANIFNKDYSKIFSEFEGKEYDEVYVLGDVKYHLGFSAKIKINNENKIKLHLAPNPSHLETVNPVVEGIVRAKIENEYNSDNSKIAPILIHGDAAIAGQGVVYEVAQMSQLDGYKTGGTIHLVINNQLGFTTNYIDARTSIYCTDVAKVIQVPIFHVNGDDAEAIAYTIQLAMEFRHKFKQDVFIDLLCYRRYGHNESDEPKFTQPVLYKIIENHPDSRNIYLNKLIEENIITKEVAFQKENDFYQMLENEYDKSKNIAKAEINPFLPEIWKTFVKPDINLAESTPNTSVDKETLVDIGLKLTEIPNLPLFKKSIKILNDRREMIKKTETLDWAMCELLAYGTLLNEGFGVRISGQDVERGTFSHRHAVLKVEDSEEEIIHLKQINENFNIYNSLLSEFGVLGFEYGYSMASPDTLTVWEAQFGDFSNGCQIITDQYLCSAEEKWKLQNGLVILLPHGYEGQGPEHSSARIERYLALCASQNMKIANCSTPANFFHLLRCQIYQEFRKPLIVFTPKSLLRNPQCVSSIEMLTNGSFLEIIDDLNDSENNIKTILFCSGKISYELQNYKDEKNISDVAIIRIEQLYPLPKNKIFNILDKYKNAKKWIWVQEEPENMGAWNFIYYNLKEIPFKVISRPPSGSTATGSSKLHKRQQQKIIEKAFENCKCERVCIECKMLCLDSEKE